MNTNLRIKTNLPNKRRLASFEGCKIDLEYELPLLFKAFKEAFASYEKEIIQTRPDARARGFEASLLNSKMIQSVQDHFPLYWKFGRYKRFVLRINGYIILFKKLNNSDRPMNIKTKSVDAISNQLSLPLFDSESSIVEPILFFGYKKNSLGEIVDPKLVYIDENQVKWTLNEDDIDSSTVSVTETGVTGPAAPKVRENLVKKKVVNNN